MNFGELKTELGLYVQDPGLSTYYGSWINDAVLQLAADFELPDLHIQGQAGTSSANCVVTTATSWLYDLPTNYMKGLHRIRNSNDDWLNIYHNLEYIYSLDASHTTTGSYVEAVAVEMRAYSFSSCLGIYPMASDKLRLWYYRKPTDMSSSSSSPDGIPAQFHRRVILPKSVLIGYEMLQDMSISPPVQSLVYWQNKLRQGLYGIAGGDIGMVNYLRKQRKPAHWGGLKGRNWL